MNRLFLYAAVAAFLVTGCKAQAPSNAAPTNAAPANQASAPVAPAAPALSPNPNCASDTTIQTPPAGSPGFDVAVTLSPAAQQKMSAGHETICISASFLAGVTDEGRKHHIGDHMDQVYFGGGTWDDEIPAAGSAHFVVPPADPAILKYVQDGKETVLINVYSGRRSNANNLLECDMFEDDVKLAEANGIHIGCKLISETG